MIFSLLTISLKGSDLFLISLDILKHCKNTMAKQQVVLVSLFLTLFLSKTLAKDEMAEFRTKHKVKPGFPLDVQTIGAGKHLQHLSDGTKFSKVLR